MLCHGNASEMPCSRVNRSLPAVRGGADLLMYEEYRKCRLMDAFPMSFLIRSNLAHDPLFPSVSLLLHFFIILHSSHLPALCPFLSPVYFWHRGTWPEIRCNLVEKSMTKEDADAEPEGKVHAAAPRSVAPCALRSMG
jgi:hypothetical protein